MQTPDEVIRTAALEFLAVLAEHPADVLHGQTQIVDLAAVVDGQQAPSLARKATVRRGRVRTPPQMSLDDAASNVMSYTDPRPGSTVETALEKLRRAVLHWAPPGHIPIAPHSAPPPFRSS